MDQDATWYGGWSRPRRHGPQIDPPAETRTAAPTHSPHLGNCYYNRPPYATATMSCLPVTLMHCGQTVGWIKMPVGVELGLVSDWDPSAPAQEVAVQWGKFRPKCFVAKLFYRSRHAVPLGLCGIVVDRDQFPHGKGHARR